MIRDSRPFPIRTALVTLSIVVGVFAFGVILTARIVIEHELQHLLSPPLQHPAEALLPVITVLMWIVGMLALVASSFLIVHD